MNSNLSDLAVGASGIVRAFNGGSRTAMRLREMGIIPGTEVRVVRLAPLGDPIEIEVRGFHLSLRKSEAAEILIEPDGLEH
jgi:Fe2+ transport system protein FeoA